MKDRIFIDSNIWIYLYDKNETYKRKIVEKLVSDNFNDIVLSVQVLNEIYNILSKKLKVNHYIIKEIIIETIANFDISSISPIEIISAMEIKEKYLFSYWDSLILASALENNSKFLFSEDMQHGQIIEEQLTVINPFQSKVN